MPKLMTETRLSPGQHIQSVGVARGEDPPRRPPLHLNNVTELCLTQVLDAKLGVKGTSDPVVLSLRGRGRQEVIHIQGNVVVAS